jgi:uncharacterized protein (TIGR03086 family)
LRETADSPAIDGETWQDVDPLVAHQRAQDAFANILANVRPDQLDDPTPCSEWKVRDLIEHVVGGNEHVAQLAGRYEQAPARPDEPTEAHQASAVAAHEVFAGPDGMTTMFQLPFGQIPGAVFIAMRTSDVLAHAWDLAAATGQATDLDPELATEQLAFTRQFVQAEFRGHGKPFGEEQPCASDRPVADQLAAFLGRKVK